MFAMAEDVDLLDKWYRIDTNRAPAFAILQPIDSHFKHFLNKKDPVMQLEDRAAWWATQAIIQAMLRKAARALLKAGSFTENQCHNYHMSVTEREVGRYD